MALVTLTDVSPLTVNNFVNLARFHYFDGTTSHRAIKTFVVQCGDPTATGTGGPGYEFADENVTGHNAPGLLCMANHGPGTNGGQFFITLVPTPWLDNKHSIFGEITEGMDVITKIGHTPTGPGDRPKTPITIQSVTIERK